uniref:cysteine-rich DPF motif domain-containing protein 1 isoform X1 n=1 Tax=Callithrix jacchus TaxID=9483 RepID=UPI00159F6E75|nr:cysteine-rich DPF motif domain-containing protein 1 isoform X1 [Callithrix jacchus]XP_035129094.1 cysteine-rich DPF motif domain-containing protein 1 isoform X1 [Callithrix jacchus]XP_054098333.1 cysteine-rich DPF motif domain-containing protein 1 isoform X1 [Callithrix jacchus]
MASHAECRPLGVFECELCALTAPYSYVGRKPPNTQSMPPGGKLCYEGSLHLREGPVPGPWLALQFVRQTGVCGPGGSAVYSTPRDSASLVSGRISVLFLRKFGKTWRKGKLCPRGPLASLLLGRECSWGRVTGEHPAQSSWASLRRGCCRAGSRTPGLVFSPLGAALQPRGAAVQLGAATGTGSCAEKVAKRQVPDQTQPGTRPGSPTHPSALRPE